MNTCPGASHELTPQALDEDDDPRRPRSSSSKAICGAPSGRARRCCAPPRSPTRPAATVAFTLSESLCIPGRSEGVRGHDRRRHDRHPVRQRGRGAAADRRGDLDGALGQALAAQVSTLVVTRGAAGALAVEGGKRVADRRRAGRRRSSTRPARATCSPPASSPPAAAADRSSAASRPARSPPPKSSRTSARGPKPTSRTLVRL